MLTDIALLTFLLSPICCLVFLIKPDWFRKILKKNLSRKKIFAFFTGLFVGSFIVVGAFSPTSTTTTIQPVLESVPAESVSPFPTATPIPTITPSPTPQPTPVPTPKPTRKPVATSPPTTRPQAPSNTQVRSFTAPVNTNSYSCNCSKTCTQMNSCEEAYYQLNTCGCSVRDGDDDGVPCETICPGG